MKLARCPIRMRALALTVVLVLVFAGCGSDSPASSESVAPTSTVSVPDEATAPSPSPVSDPATTAPTTTPDSDPATTVPTTPPSAAWTDADAYPSGYGMGCCGANSTGSASPALTASPAPIADGTYALDVVGWSPQDPTRLQVSVRSLVPCADGVVGCSPLADGTYGPDEVGYSEESRTIVVTLDDSVVVYLAGDDIDAPVDQGQRSILRSTNGNGLAELMTAIAEAYETEIATPLRAGTAVDDIVADLQANPRSGFTSAAEQMTGQLYFTFGDAPPVLFQAVANQGEPLERSGTSVLIPRTFAIQQGAISLELYAGFRS
jgi:hypothetical protein